MSGKNKDYWDGYSEGKEQSVGEQIVQDFCEALVSGMTFGLYDRSDESRQGLEDGRENKHD